MSEMMLEILLVISLVVLVLLIAFRCHDVYVAMPARKQAAAAMDDLLKWMTHHHGTHPGDSPEGKKLVHNCIVLRMRASALTKWPSPFGQLEEYTLLHFHQLLRPTTLGD